MQLHTGAVVLSAVNIKQCCQVCGLPVESGYFITVAVGCFSSPRVDVTPIT